MPKPDKIYRKTTIGEHRLSPDSLVIGYGYDPHMSEGSIKPPIFMTSTFAFKSAADGEALFQAMAGKTPPGEAPREDLIYTRFNNPNMEVLEDRLTLFDGGEAALVFSSGMGAITTTLLAMLRSGQHVVMTSDCYRRTRQFVGTVLARYGVEHTLGVRFYGGQYHLWLSRR